MKYAVEMGSGVMMYIPSFVKISSGIQKLMGRGIHRHTDTQHEDCISQLSFFQNKEIMPKIAGFVAPACGRLIL
jgi:hypothetical protein